MLYRAVLERDACDVGFSRFVGVQHVEDAVLVAFAAVFDFAEGFVGRPEVGVAAIFEEGLRRYGGRRGGFGGGLGGFGGGGGEGGSGGFVFHGRLLFEEVSELWGEIVQRIAFVGWRFFGGREPPHDGIGQFVCERLYWELQCREILRTVGRLR